MNNNDFSVYIDNLLNRERLLGGAQNEYILTGCNNLLRDYNNACANLEVVDLKSIIQEMYQERNDNIITSMFNGDISTWRQAYAEKTILENFLIKLD